MKHHGAHHETSEKNAVEYLKFAAVITLIFAASFALYSSFDLSGWLEWMRVFMGTFLIVFSAFKFMGYKMFVMMFRGYDLIAKRFNGYSYAYPFVELLLGIAFLTDLLPIARSILVLLVMGIGAIGVAQEIYHKRSGVYCACLGNIIKLPLSTVSLVENVTMAAMALVMIFAAL